MQQNNLEIRANFDTFLSRGNPKLKSCIFYYKRPPFFSGLKLDNNREKQNVDEIHTKGNMTIL
jgi:hypothetical protein